MKSELNEARNHLRERESQADAQMKNKLKHDHELEKEIKSLQSKYTDAVERLSTETIQLERLQEQLKQSTRRCEQLEKEKVQIRPYLALITYLFPFDRSASLVAQEIGIYHLSLLVSSSA
jgi:chromosome segregation ATPase